MELSKDLKSRQEVRDLAAQAAEAQKLLAKMNQEKLDQIVEAVFRRAADCAEQLARMAVEETGFGNVKDKITKNKFASHTLWQAVKDQKTVGILRKDPEHQVWDVGVPVGVIAGITPSTNPTSTVIYKTIIALKSGNAIVFSPHPNAAKCTLETARLLAAAAEQAGCPRGAVACITIPTMDAVQELMRHPEVKLILATGGSAMVKAAYSSGTPAIGVGAGNGPAYLHPSCDLEQAAADIVRSKTFDHGVVCASEQSLIVHRQQVQAVEAELIRQGCCILSEEDGKKLAALLFRSNGTMNPRLVGKSASVIAELADLSPQARNAKVLLARETGVGRQFAYSMEKLCPVLGLYCVEDEAEALKLSCRILHHEGRGHTFTMHCRQQDVIERFAAEVPVSRFLVNTPAAFGGVGLTTGLFPALTLGCGAVGGSSSSNNIGPLDLINIRRVAWGHKNHETVQNTENESSAQQEPLLDILTEKLLKRLLEKEHKR